MAGITELEKEFFLRCSVIDKFISFHELIETAERILPTSPDVEDMMSNNEFYTNLIQMNLAVSRLTTNLRESLQEYLKAHPELK